MSVTGDMQKFERPVYGAGSGSGSGSGLRLNIACATNMFAGWVNLDRVDQQSYIDTLKAVDAGSLALWPEPQRKLAEQVQAGLVSCAVKDLREGFHEYADGSVEAIYLGQMVEHLNPLYELPQFLAECLRMLKPGGAIRVTTPDLSVLMGAYMDGNMLKFAPEQPEWYFGAPPSAQLSYLMFGACGPDCTFDRYEGHFSCFTTSWFQQILERAGFIAVAFNGEKSPEFADTIDCGMSHSFSAEARKAL